MTRVTADVTAYHEAGHAVAYIAHLRRFRYVTVRPRSRDRSGQVVVRPRKIDPIVGAVIAAAGPVAEAILGGLRDPDDDYEFADRLAGAVLVGGLHDWQVVEALPDQAQTVVAEVAERLVRANWAAVRDLAFVLADRGTLNYSEALDIYRGAS